MTYSFKTKIVFHRTLSQLEQFAFWLAATKSIKDIALTGPADFNSNMEWSVDYTESNLSESEAKTRFSIFLDRQKDIIKDFSLYTPTAA